MLVPDVVADSTSPSLAKPPLVTMTVPPTRLRSSGSDTLVFGDSVVVVPEWKVTVDATLLSTGGSLTLVMPIVVVCGGLRLNDAPPSFTVQVTVRVGSAP